MKKLKYGAFVHSMDYNCKWVLQSSNNNFADHCVGQLARDLQIVFPDLYDKRRIKTSNVMIYGAKLIIHNLK